MLSTRCFCYNNISVAEIPGFLQKGAPIGLIGKIELEIDHSKAFLFATRTLTKIIRILIKSQHITLPLAIRPLWSLTVNSGFFLREVD